MFTNLGVLLTTCCTLLLLLLAAAGGGLAGQVSVRGSVGGRSDDKGRLGDRPAVAAAAFSLSSAIPDIFLGQGAGRRPRSQSRLRSQLDTLLDSVGPHYSGLLRRVHELHQPQVEEMMQDLLLLGSERPSNGQHLSAVADENGRGGAAAAAGGVENADGGGDGSSSSPAEEPPYPTPQPLPWRLSSAPTPPSLADWCRLVSSRLSALPPDAAMSFPVLRRLLTAVVVRTWLDGWREGGRRMMSQADEEAARGLFTQLYTIHRRGAIERGLLDFHHVSKSGGTSWCHAAELNGCTTKLFDKLYECAVPEFDDGVRWVDPAIHRNLTGQEPVRWSLYGVFRSETVPAGCTGRAAHMRANHWITYSNEYVLTGGERSMADVEVCAKQFVTAILFRNPISRLLSNLRFLLLHYKRYMGDKARAANRTAEGEAAYFRTYANANTSFWQRIAPAMTNNYYIRSLLGETVWHDPVGSINATHHLPAARLVLMQYDIVVPTESPKEVASRLLAYGAGWPVSYSDVHDKNITEIQKKLQFNPAPYMPSGEDLSYLNRQQALDMQLYKHAVLISQLDYLVYDTAAAAGVVPWDGMPAALDPSDKDASFRVACGLIRGPGGAWGDELVHRRTPPPAVAAAGVK